MLKIMNKILLFLFLLLICVSGLTQTVWNRSDNTALRKGNKAYQSEDFALAGEYYTRALTINPQNEKADFNMGDNLFKQKKFKEASTQFEQIANQSKDLKIQADSWYNAGNSRMEESNFSGAIEAYKEALRRNPKHTEARYNLSYAMQKLTQNEQNKEKNKDQKPEKDKNKEEKDKEEQEKKKQEEEAKKEKEKQEQEKKGNQEKSNSEQNDNKEKPDPKMSEEEVKRLLQTLKEEEEKVRQRYLQNKNRNNSPSNHNNKDW